MPLHGNPSLVNPGLAEPPEEPLGLLRLWFQQATEIGINEPDSLVLSTVDSDGWPSSRVVALKACDKLGLVFGTHCDSKKGRDLTTRPWAAGTLWWRETIQQVNCAGRVARLSDCQSDALFGERTREAQAVTAISRQSLVLEDEQELRARVQALLNSTDPINRPAGWAAFRLVPSWIEFWHGRPDRFHARVRYELREGAWIWSRLQP